MPKKSSVRRNVDESLKPPPTIASTLVNDIPQKSLRPLIFISHDHRDALLAEAFANLLTDSSGGFLKSFRSSDRKGGAGIEFGAEWYSEIMSKIENATDVVALLTVNSIDRPWILYEAGVAKGKLGKPVFGIVMGVGFDQAARGPFAQFQNSSDDEDSLTKLVLQLIQRNSDAEPREEAVRRQVSAFRGNITKLISQEPKQKPAKASDAEASDAAKLFEEIKVMFRDLPERLHGQLSESLDSRARRRSRLRRPDIFFNIGDPETAWLMTISMFRDDAPWLYEMGLDVHRALLTGNTQKTARAIDRLEKMLDNVIRSRLGRNIIDSPELEMAIHELAPMARHFLLRGLRTPTSPPLPARKLKTNEQDEETKPS